MALKKVVDSLDDVEESYRGLYTEKDGKFYLDLEDDDNSNLKKALERERDAAKKAAKLAKDLQAQIEKFKDIDPEKAREALTKLEELENKQLIDENKIDELFAKRTEKLKSDLEAKLNAASTRAETAENALKEMRGNVNKGRIATHVQDALSELATVKKGAMPYVVGQFQQLFSVTEDEEIVSLDEKGNVRYGPTGNSPLTIKERMVDFIKENPYFFEESKGGGGQGGGGSPGSKSMKRSEFDKLNPTAQMKAVENGVEIFD